MATLERASVSVAQTIWWHQRVLRRMEGRRYVEESAEICNGIYTRKRLSEEYMDESGGG